MVFGCNVFITKQRCVVLLVCVVGDLAVASFAEGLVHLRWVSLVASCGDHLCAGVHRLLDSGPIAQRVPVVTRATKSVLPGNPARHLVLELVDLHVVASCLVSHVVLRMPDHNCAQKARYKQSNAAKQKIIIELCTYGCVTCAHGRD